MTKDSNTLEGSKKGGEKSSSIQNPNLKVAPRCPQAENAGVGSAPASNKAPIAATIGGAAQEREVSSIRIADITIPVGRRGFDADIVRELALSISEIGLITPITIRSVDSVVDSVKTTVWELVSGRHRREAAISLCWESIDCFIFEGDDNAARLYAIDENSRRGDQVVLDRSEDIAERVQIMERMRLAGHVVQKGLIGRPEGGVALASRQLNIQAESDEARRKLIARAIKIASIPAEVKAATRAAGLANNQTALLDIAKEKTPKAQLKKVRELKDRSSKPRCTRSAPIKPNTARQPAPLPENGAEPANAPEESAPQESDQPENEAVESPPTAPAESIDPFEIPRILRRTDGAKTFGTVKSRWAQFVEADWADLPAEYREKFIREVLGYPVLTTGKVDGSED